MPGNPCIITHQIYMYLIKLDPCDWVFIKEILGLFSFSNLFSYLVFMLTRCSLIILSILSWLEQQPQLNQQSGFPSFASWFVLCLLSLCFWLFPENQVLQCLFRLAFDSTTCFAGFSLDAINKITAHAVFLTIQI